MVVTAMFAWIELPREASITQSPGVKFSCGDEQLDESGGGDVGLRRTS